MRNCPIQVCWFSFGANTAKLTYFTVFNIKQLQNVPTLPFRKAGFLVFSKSQKLY